MSILRVIMKTLRQYASFAQRCTSSVLIRIVYDGNLAFDYYKVHDRNKQVLENEAERELCFYEVWNRVIAYFMLYRIKFVGGSEE